MKRQYTDKGSTRVGPNADAWVPGNGLNPNTAACPPPSSS